MTDSLVDNNTSGSSGGGIYSASPSADITLINTTLSTNTASSQGGGLTNCRDAELINVTVANNVAGSAGGLHESGSAITTIQNSIVAGNTSTTDALEDVSGTFSSLGFNLIGVISGGTGWIASDLLNTNPLLNPLADNGGSTRTHSLQAVPGHQRGIGNQRTNGRPAQLPP